MADRIVGIADTLEACEKVISLPAECDAGEDKIALVGKDIAARHDMPDGGVYESDALPAAQRGAARGGIVSLLADLIALAATPVTSSIALVGLPVASGASLGALGATLAGKNETNSKLSKYIRAVNSGRLLIIIDNDSIDVQQIAATKKDRLSGVVVALDSDDSLMSSIL